VREVAPIDADVRYWADPDGFSLIGMSGHVRVRCRWPSSG